MSEVVEMLAREIGRQVVGELSKRYGFDRNDAEAALKLDKVVVRIIERNIEKKSTVILPFSGEINGGCCYGIRLNHGLYTQCTNEISDHTGRHPVCSTCSKQQEKNSNGEPTYGYITTRLEQGENYRVKGKSPVNYGNVMEKLNISKEEAVKAATAQGWTIPEEQFEVKKATRGRPKKDATATDTASETSEIEPTTQEKKQRGRPKKDKKVVSSNPGDDMIAALVEKANKKPEKVEEPTKEKEPEKVEEQSEDEDDDEADSISAQPIKITKTGYVILESENGEAPPGTTHLLNPTDNTLYDPETHDHVGTWNPTTKKIDPLAESDED